MSLCYHGQGGPKTLRISLLSMDDGTVSVRIATGRLEHERTVCLEARTWIAVHTSIWEVRTCQMIPRLRVAHVHRHSARQDRQRNHRSRNTIYSDLIHSDSAQSRIYLWLRVDRHRLSPTVGAALSNMGQRRGWQCRSKAIKAGHHLQL